MTPTTTQPITEFYSDFLTSNILISGLELLKEANPKTVFICLDTELSTFLTKISANLNHSCVISYHVVAQPSFNLNSDTLKSYSAFLAFELQPYLTKLTQTPLNIILVGQQFSSILATYTITTYQHVISGALSLSGSFYWKPQTEKKWEWFTRWLAGESNCPTHICLLSSIHETLQPPRTVPTTRMANEHLYNVLKAKKCNVTLREFSSVKLSQDFFTELQSGCEWLIDHLEAS